MKQFIIITLASLVLVACGGNNAVQNTDANLELVQEYLRAVEDKDYQKMSEMLADDYMGYGPSIYDSINKEQAVEAWKYNAENVYETIEYQRVQFLPASVAEGPAAGDWVSAWATLELWFKGSDTPVNLLINSLYKIEDSKIVISRSIYNQTDVMKQLGLPTFPPLFLPEGTELDLENMDTEETMDEMAVDVDA